MLASPGCREVMDGCARTPPGGPQRNFMDFASSTAALHSKVSEEKHLSELVSLQGVSLRITDREQLPNNSI